MRAIVDGIKEIWYAFVENRLTGNAQRFGGISKGVETTLDYSQIQVVPANDGVVITLQEVAMWVIAINGSLSDQQKLTCIVGIPGIDNDEIEAAARYLGYATQFLSQDAYVFMQDIDSEDAYSVTRFQARVEFRDLMGLSSSNLH